MSTRRVDSLPSAGLKLLVTGICLSLPVSLIAIAITWWVAGSLKGMSCALGAITGLVAMAFSQFMMTAASKISAQMAMIGALTSYGIAMLGVIFVLSWVKSGDNFDVLWVAIGIIISGATYIVGVLIAHAQLRLLHYGNPEDDTLEDE